jgi:hypothetical protein
MKHICLHLAPAVFCLLGHAAVLETVPRQGGMLMPEVYYHANTDSVTVDMSALYDQYGNPIIAQLTPLLVSDPGDSFDPASPWYVCLDPSQQGQAFSRRYGYDMDVMTDYLPDNRALWIRNLGSSPALSFFDYMDQMYNPENAPPTWNPILGTAGTTNAVYWNLGMWHMPVTAPPAPPGTTNTYSATIEIFVVNTDTGQEVTNSGFAFVLTWTDVPDGRPSLNIASTPANGAVISWLASATNWTLVSTTNLACPNWAVVTNPPAALTNGLSAVYLDCWPPQQFFTMQLNP